MPSSGAVDQCMWCERERELVDSDLAGFLVAGPDGNVLTLEYGIVCEECWDDIIQQWEQNGDLTKPLTAYGGASA